MRRALTILVLTPVLFLGCAGAGMAAEKTIKFDDDVCTHTARFDPAKWPEARVRAALAAVYQPDTMPIGGLFDSPQSVASYDIAEYRKQCAEVKDKIQKLDGLGLPEMEAYRTALAADAVETCAYGEIRYRVAQGDGKALQDFQPAAGKCTRYGDALEGKTDIEAAWRANVAESCANNASVARCKGRAEADYAKPDGRERARLHVLGYGWNNCAVNFLRINLGETQRLRDAAKKRLAAVLKVRLRPCVP